MSRRGRLAILVAGLAVGIGAELARHFGGEAPDSRAEIVGLVLGLAIGLSFVASGVVAWSRRPESRIGPLMVVVGLLWFVGRLDFAADDRFQMIGAWVRPLHIAVFAHLLLAFPSGKLESRAARALVAAAYVNVAVIDNAPQYLPGERLGEVLFDASQVVTSLIFVAIIGALVWRWRVGTAAWRRAVAPLVWPGALALATLIVFFANELAAQPLGAAPGWAFRVAYAAFPLLFLVGLLRARLARASIAELVVELGEASPSGSLRESLARALGDPTLQLAYWLPDEQRYVDLEGRSVELPGAEEPRTVTVVEREGVRVAALVHDEAVAEDRELLRAVSAAAALALENERLQAELRARLADLRASRARIVEAADAERRRIERNLHDATQQRLTSVAIALGLAASRLSTDPDEAAATLDQAREALTTALAELRDLTQGIHPGILTERGLAPALEDLAYTAPFPVKVATDVDGRLPEQVEAGAYYVAAEALANVAKHAYASSARIEIARRRGSLLVHVRDDGVGGADPRGGSGIRGLVDRVQALGGTLAVESPPGEGTDVRAEIPCG
ncbi:MAG TPA: sensor histidine kinase [Gaiellaceae bacterium]|nr:sensor histidine kinase [Gaiellaceae bacterium]